MLPPPALILLSDVLKVPGQSAVVTLALSEQNHVWVSPQVVVVYAATKGYLDKVPVSETVNAEAAILKHVNPAIYKVLKAKVRTSFPVCGDQHCRRLVCCVSLVG